AGRVHPAHRGRRVDLAAAPAEGEYARLRAGHGGSRRCIAGDLPDAAELYGADFPRHYAAGADPGARAVAGHRNPLLALARDRSPAATAHLDGAVAAAGRS